MMNMGANDISKEQANDNTKLLFGGVLVTILLLIYAYLVSIAILVVTGRIPFDSFTPQMASTMSLIHGLVAALVVAELAITAPGEPPGTRILAANPTPGAKRIVKPVILAYLTIWTAAGLAGFFWGFLRHAGTLSALTDLGQSWIGIAIAAGYAYFGIQPSKSGGPPVEVVTAQTASEK
jgi:hypothetical protein